MEPTVLIIGSSDTALSIARDLTADSTDAVLAMPPDSRRFNEAEALLGSDHVLAEARILGCDGAIGNFTVRLSVGGRDRIRSFGAIVLAQADIRQQSTPMSATLPADRVIGLSELHARLSAPTDAFPDGIRHLVFLNGLESESHPVITAAVLHASLRLQQDHGVQTYVLTRNLKVAADGLEALYRNNREAGTVFVKFDTDLPRLESTGDGRPVIAFQDPVTGMPFTLTPDLLVADERVRPSPDTIHAARCLGLEIDPAGFAQGDNVHRLTVGTNRPGIFVAGPARGVQSQAEQVTDSANAAAAVIDAIRADRPDTRDRAVIDKGQCIRCLTCYRLCPYRAVGVQRRVVVLADACQRCGICAAECPRRAITIPGLSPDELLPAAAATKRSVKAPAITAFCCTRSAADALNQARVMGAALPDNMTLVEVPCAGSVSVDHLSEALRRGADGVLVLTCHDDNCHSQNGSRHAKSRVDHLGQRFDPMGFEPDRLQVRSLASNMGAVLADELRRFEAALTKLGPSRLTHSHTVAEKKTDRDSR